MGAWEDVVASGGIGSITGSHDGNLLGCWPLCVHLASDIESVPRRRFE